MFLTICFIEFVSLVTRHLAANLGDAPGCLRFGQVARRARLTILPDPSVIDIEGERILLMHGDTLCTDDVRYQAFRAQTRTAAWQRTFLDKPLSERQAFAAQARAESQRYTRSVEDAITDVNDETVRETMADHEVRKLIHGHTHRPAHHHFELSNSKAAERIVLDDWYEQGSALRTTASNRAPKNL